MATVIGSVDLPRVRGVHNAIDTVKNVVKTRVRNERRHGITALFYQFWLALPKSPD